MLMLLLLDDNDSSTNIDISTWWFPSYFGGGTGCIYTGVFLSSSTLLSVSRGRARVRMDRLVLVYICIYIYVNRYIYIVRLFR